MIRTTSIESYKELKAQGQDINDQEKVYLALKIAPDSTDSEICMILGFEDKNKVRPRRKELLDQGYIESTHKRECSITKRLCHVWRIIK